MSLKAVRLRNAQETSPLVRLIARFLAILSLAGAFVAAVVDGARSIGADQLALTSLGVTLYWAIPAKFALLQPFVEGRFGPAAWDPFVVSLLKAPTLVVFALLGMGLLFLVRRRRPTVGYSSRPG